MIDARRQGRNGADPAGLLGMVETEEVMSNGLLRAAAIDIGEEVRAALLEDAA